MTILDVSGLPLVPADNSRLVLKDLEGQFFPFHRSFLERLGKSMSRRCRLVVRYREYSKIVVIQTVARCREIAFRKPAVGAMQFLRNGTYQLLDARNIGFTASANDNALCGALIRICSPSIVRVST